MEDLEVWRRFKAGSEADFTLLYRQYAPIMLRYGNKLTNDRDLAKDCIQQVFFQIWKSRANLSTPPSVKNYLLKAFRCELGKKAAYKSKYETINEDMEIGSEVSHETALINIQSFEFTQKKIAHLLQQLPDRQREIIFLKYFTGLQYDEIADVMGIDQKSVYKLTYKAIDKLHKLFKAGAQPVAEAPSLRQRMSGFASSFNGTSAEKPQDLESIQVAGSGALLFGLKEI
ncbi:RNA polymerase sigma factor [Pontibacter rugosus]|uniref:RNA polymerase sigma factor n=1 Tax=Pontibacter rugosus TaxID=1745966 RepID=A0ABW3STW9_9BACT